jgi:hypothetical protein
MKAVVVLIICCVFVLIPSGRTQSGDELKGLPFFPAPDKLKLCLPIKVIIDEKIAAEKVELIEKFREQWWLGEKQFPRARFTDKEIRYFASLRSLPIPRADDYNRQAASSTLDSKAASTGSKTSDTLPPSGDPAARGKRAVNCHEVTPMRTRKEYRQLSYAERTSLHTAIQNLKTFIPDPVGAPGVNAYDMFVTLHRYTTSPGAHSGPAFLPWHREFLFRYIRIYVF